MKKKIHYIAYRNAVTDNLRISSGKKHLKRSNFYEFESEVLRTLFYHSSLHHSSYFRWAYSLENTKYLQYYTDNLRGK